MKNRLLYSLLLFCLNFGHALAQTDSSEIYLLRRVANLRNDSISGTAVFVQNKNNEIFLVSCVQVAKGIDKNATITLQGDDNLPFSLKLSDFANPVQWVYHPLVDVAVLRLNPRAYIFNKYLLQRTIPLDNIDSTKIPISKSTTLSIVGYATGWQVRKNYPPLIYTTYPVSGFVNLKLTETKDTQSIIILQDLRMTGFAGGPVFLSNSSPVGPPSPTNKVFRMAGLIMHGDIQDETGRQVNVMTPAYYIHDLIK